MMMDTKPLYLINSSAPTRICDNGGWTDTWFAEYGSVFNIAIEPRAHVQILVYPRAATPAQITISATNFDDVYTRELGMPWQKHPLIEAAIEQIGISDDVSIKIELYSDAPPGASMGTSAAVVVALVGALDCLTDGQLSPYEVAMQAQRVETVQLGRQCGIQDQLAAAFGGINFIDMYQYPHAQVFPLELDETTLYELERRLLVVYLGKPHDSSQVHEMVIAALEDEGPEASGLARLRETAVSARDALLASNFAALGQSFIANTEGQCALHSGLINPRAQQVMDLAERHHALGWKVNGAGGQGGSVAILLNEYAENRHLLLAALQELDDCQLIYPRLARDGLVCYLCK